MIKINQGQMLKDHLSTSHIYFWQCVSCTATLIIKPFQFFFVRTQFYQTLLKLSGAFNLQLLY